ncbi:Phosphoglucosamine mutase [Aquimixticola soesokkakensis]|uniref:Phosphoglucosamine mutase n=1 Tax=Aquimixticola soesokkakensis TaxID=1519096 RepID=A0A1Y5SQM9_9RHOB|nr:hypothetical protein [Aquimixticola soesokkakensis]SLN45723.1 Phosphoglucosamine mutase [Aquimixticola soesokkakensis]
MLAPAFDICGLRAATATLTADLLGRYIQAFLATCAQREEVFVSRDLSPCAAHVARNVSMTVRALGFDVVDCDPAPSPALALAATQGSGCAIMVSGAPAAQDSISLQFFTPSGALTCAQATDIAQGANTPYAPSKTLRGGQDYRDIGAGYVARYLNAFGSDALTNITVGVYEHAAVARDLLSEILTALGATAIPLLRAQDFSPADPEAIPDDTRALMAELCGARWLDTVVSTDSLGERPLLSDEHGRFIGGDHLGVLTARMLNADTICTSVACNDVVRRIDDIATVHFTPVGAAHISAAMRKLQHDTPAARVIGFEPNGGVFLGFTADLRAPLTPLMTRDGIFPIIATLAAARLARMSVGDLVAGLPPCFKQSDLMSHIDPAKAERLVGDLSTSSSARRTFFSDQNRADSIDCTDGLRVSFEGGDVVHLRPCRRPAGLRILTHANSAQRAFDLLTAYRGKIENAVK